MSTIYSKNEALPHVVAKIIFFVPKFAPNLLILQLAGLSSVESEIDTRSFLFLGSL